MKHRSSRNHHNGPHAAGDPLGVYLPPLAQWHGDSAGRFWFHPSLSMVFKTWKPATRGRIGGGARWVGFVTTAKGSSSTSEALSPTFKADTERTVYKRLQHWYAVQTLASVGHSALRNSSDRIYASPRAVAVFIYKSENGGYDVNAVPNCKWAGSVNGYLIGHTHATTLAAANKAARAEVKHFLEVGSKSVLVVDVNDNHRKYTLKHRRGVAA